MHNLIKLFFIFLVSILLTLLVGSQIFAEPSQLQQARQYYEQGNYQNAIAILESYLKTDENDKLEAYYSLGKAYASLGQFGAAIRIWDRAILSYHNKGNNRQLAQVSISQAQAYIDLGQVEKAIEILNKISPQVQSLPELEASTRGVLGNAYLNQGNWEQAIKAYLATFKLSRTTKRIDLASAALNNLTTASLRLTQQYERDAFFAEQEKDESEINRLKLLADRTRHAASQYAREAVEVSRQSNDSFATIRALINATPLVEQQEASKYRLQASNLLTNLPASQTKVYLLLKSAQVDEANRESLLKQAVQTASAIGDNRSLSFAFGALGKEYEREKQYQQALSATQFAQNAAAQIFAYDSLYQWQWLEGRIARKQGKVEEANSAYLGAIASLQKIRPDITKASKELQLDFQQEIEPIYRELLSLLLSEKQPDLKKVLEISDLLQLAQIEDFFGDVCTEIREVIAPQEFLAKTNTVVITSIILQEQTNLIVQLPTGKLYRHEIEISAPQLTKLIERWRYDLENPYNNQYLDSSRSLYDLLIRPLESTLKIAKPKTLVFIQDGILRNVPLSALHDGKQFLIEKYALAYSLGLKFLTRSTSSSQKALTFGLTVAKPPFNQSLPEAVRETERVSELLGGKRFLDREFTSSNLQTQIEDNNYSIVHLATHGKFSGTLEKTFIQAYDRLITLKEIERLLLESQNPIDLLTFSACQTAAGNDRSVLGLAGVAIRSGVNSSLGSLWFVNDRATSQLITSFYQNLQAGLSKAEALRQAQIEQIKVNSTPSRPNVWSGFILLGNWT